MYRIIEVLSHSCCHFLDLFFSIYLSCIRESIVPITEHSTFSLFIFLSYCSSCWSVKCSLTVHVCAQKDAVSKKPWGGGKYSPADYLICLSMHHVYVGPMWIGLMGVVNRAVLHVYANISADATVSLWHWLLFFVRFLILFAYISNSGIRNMRFKAIPSPCSYGRSHIIIIMDAQKKSRVTLCLFPKLC